MSHSDTDPVKQIRELQTKLDTLRAALCKRCKQIDVESPQNLHHLQQCFNARKSISHTSEAADIIRDDTIIELVPLDESFATPSKKRERKQSLHHLQDQKKRQDTTIEPVNEPVSLKDDLTKSRRTISGGQIPDRIRQEGEKVKRSSSASELLTKIKRPFKKKSKLSSASVVPPTSKRPITTGSGVLVPKLAIGASNEGETEIAPPQAYTGSSPVNNTTSSSLPVNLLRSMSDDEENTEHEEKDMPDDDSDGEDPPFVSAVTRVPSKKKPILCSPDRGSPGKLDLNSSPKLSNVAVKLLNIHQKLVDQGVSESNLRELLEISDLLGRETSNQLKPFASPQETKRQRHGKVKKLFKKNLSDVSAKNTKKELPEHEEMGLYITDPFAKKIHKTKQILMDSKYQHGYYTHARSRSLRVNDLTPINTKFTSKRRRCGSLVELYSWENSPSYHMVAHPGATRPNTPRNISLTISDVGTFQPEAGLVLDLFQWILLQPRQNSDEVQSFLLMYRGHVSAAVLFNIICKKWEESVTLNVSVAKIIFVLEQWIEHFFMADFAPNRLLSQQLWQFIGQYFKNTDGFRMLTRSWFNQHFIRTSENKANPTKPAITPICKIDLVNDSLIEIARQMTLIEFGLWEKIHVFDYLLDDLKQSNMINATIDRFNRVSSWVATEIIKIPTIKKRAIVIKQFIALAQACFEMNNFNTLLEITAGLNLVPIRRLRKTWRQVPKRFTDLLDELEDIMDHHQNYKRYRQTLRDCGRPCLPYLGVIRRDLTMIHIGNKNIVQRNFLNFEKGKLLWDVLKEVVHLQQTAFRFHKNPPVFNALNNLFVFDEDTLYKYSLEWEPTDTPLFDDE